MPSIDLVCPVPGPRSRAVFAERVKQVAPGPFHTTPIVAERAAGATITDVDGNTFLDFACGIGVANLGHSEPSVVAAAKAQADKFFHTSINVVAYEGYVDVARRLNERAPGDFAKKTFLANSGAEAVENAILTILRERAVKFHLGRVSAGGNFPIGVKGFWESRFHL